MRKKLTKSRSNIVISGVLGGIGDYLNIDPTILRVIFIILTFFGAGTPAVLYFILMLVMPTERNSYSQGNTDRYQGYHRYNQQSKRSAPRKEAEKVDDDDEWSDF